MFDFDDTCFCTLLECYHFRTFQIPYDLSFALLWRSSSSCRLLCGLSNRVREQTLVVKETIEK
jgi:hypothetical protein